MPPTNQPPNFQTIIRPGDQSLRDANGKITQFGTFQITSDRAQLQAETGVIMGVYGDGGNGKTTFACSLADRTLNPEGYDLPVGVLDSMAGIKSVANLVGPDLQRIPIRSVADLEQFVRVARANPRQTFPWKTLVMDNVSDLVPKALRDQGFHNQSVPGGGMTSSQPDFNAMTTRIYSVLSDLCDLAPDYGVNIILLFWELTEKSEAGNITGYKADLTPTLARKVKGMLDYIGYLTVLNNPPHWTRKLDLSPNPELDAKTHTVRGEPASRIPFELYNPTLPAIFDTIKRGVPFPSDKFQRPKNPLTQK